MLEQERESRRPPLDPYGEERRREIAERMDFPDLHDRLMEEERSFTLDGPGKRDLMIAHAHGVPDWRAGEPDIRDASPLLRSRLEKEAPAPG